MEALSHYFSTISVKPILPVLSPAVADAIQKLLDLIAENDGQRANVAEVHKTLSPLAASTASANKSLNLVLRKFNESAEKVGSPIRLEITAGKRGGAVKRWIWFEGPPPAPKKQSMPELERISPEHGLPSENKLVEDQRSIPLDDPHDGTVVLLTVNKHETRAVLNAYLGTKTPPSRSINGITYNLLGIHHGLRIVHAIAEMGQGNPNAMQSISRKVIGAWEPLAVIAVGVAFGANKGKQNIGDVLVSRNIQDYELSRVNSDGSVTPRGSRPDASPDLVNRISSLEQSYSDEEKLKRKWPKIRKGTILTGSKLIDNLDYRNSLLKLHGDEIVGGEMEGLGLYVSASEQKVDWLIVKGICDWADGNKGSGKEAKQKLAAENAATVVKNCLGISGLYSANPSKKRPSQPSHKAHPSIGEMGLDDLDRAKSHLLCKTRSTKTSLQKDDLKGARESEQQEIDTLEYLLDWALDSKAPPLLALLGEYGMGKTISCQRLARELEAKRQDNPQSPPCLYFDLRRVAGLSGGVPAIESVIEQCVAFGWAGDDRQFRYKNLMALAKKGAIIIFDGLDEVLVKLNEADGQVFTNHLLKILSDVQTEVLTEVRTKNLRAINPRMLVSCRTQYFRTLRDQKTHFTGQERGGPDHGDYQALLLLPLDEGQIRHYLSMVLPEADPEQLMELIRSVHNLEDLAQRPYTLSLLANFIPEIERLRTEGKVIRGVTLYRMAVQSWLDRDDGKHHIKPEHKLRLMSHLAGNMARDGKTILAVENLESWLHEWLESQPDLRRRYQQLHPDHLEEDLRTATFLRRVDGKKECGFRFAHTSLFEYFLADYLFQAIATNRPELWALPIPSVETLNFLGQMLDEAGEDKEELMTTLQSWRHKYRLDSSELLLAYASAALTGGWPVPILHGIHLQAAKLKDLRFGKPKDSKELLNLGLAQFQGADLRGTRFYHVDISEADFSNAKLEKSEWRDCILKIALFKGANAAGGVFRRCNLAESDWEDSLAHRTQFIHCSTPLKMPPVSLIAPISISDQPQKHRLEPLGGHSSLVTSAAFSPDGSLLLSASDDRTLKLWDARSGECLRTMKGHSSRITSAAFSPDSSLLLSVSWDQTLKLWDAKSGECLSTMKGHSYRVTSAAFSPDGSLLLSASGDRTLKLWDARSGECLRTMKGHSARVTSAAFSPDSSLLLSASWDLTLKLWDSRSGECLRTMKGHSCRVTSAAFSPDGSLLISASHDRTLKLWDSRSGMCLRTMKGHSDWVTSAAFLPDGSLLLSASDDRTLKLWDARSGECLRTMKGHLSQVASAAFSPDGSLLLSASDDRTLKLWNARSGECLRTMEGHSSGVTSAAFSPDGSLLLSACDNRTLKLWGTKSGMCLRTMEGHSSGVTSATFSPEGNLLLSTSDDQTLKLWDARSGECLRTMEGHSSWVTSAAFSPDARFLLSASHDQTLKLWNAKSGMCLRTMEEHSFGVTSAAFSPDGRFLLSGSDDRTLKLWDAKSGECLRTMEGHSSGVTSAAFSPDARFLLSASDDRTLKLWDARSGVCLRTVEGHSSQVTSAAFSPDGSLLLSASDDRTLKLWDARSGECLRVHAQENQSHAVWDPRNDKIVEASAEAWRWLHWQIWHEEGGWMPVPLETFGDPPLPKRMQANTAH